MIDFRRLRYIIAYSIVAFAIAPSVRAAQDFDGVKPIKIIKKSVSCLANNCEITLQQAVAIGHAVSLYEHEIRIRKGLSVAVGVDNKNLIVIAIFPKVVNQAPSYSDANKTITYYFDATGRSLKRKVYTR